VVITHMSKPMTMRIWRCWIVTFLSGLLLSVSVPTVSAWAAQPMPSPEGQAFLDPEQAFVFQARLKDAKTIEAQWDIADGVTMYRDKIALSLVGEGVSLGAFTLPQGQEKTDEFSGVQQVYHGRVTVLLPLERKGAEKSTAELTAVFQGCADGGVCYPPITKKIKLELPPLAVEMAVATDVSAEATEKTVSEQDQLAGTLAGGNTLLTLVTFFGLGLLLSLTPCIFPMIPILSGIIIGHGKNITTGRAFSLSLIYVLAMSVAYTLAGVLAGLFGANLQAAFQNPWSLGLFALVFVLLALSMFGLYDLQLPASWQTRMDRISRSQHGSKIAGVAVMGFFSAIIVGPCVAPPLMGALIYIGKTGDAILGGAALFSLSLGMGAPLLIVGTTAGKFIPKAGGWLNSVKAIFGVLLLAVAIWLLDRVLPGRLTMFLWAALMVFSGIYLGALDHLTSESPGWKRFWKGFGLLILVYGLLLFIGAAAGATDPLKPLTGFGASQPASSLEKQPLKFVKIKTVADLQQELAKAADANKTVMLDFYADWCSSCKELEQITFNEPRVQNLLTGSVLLQADVTANDQEAKKLLQHFDLIGPPAVIFFGPDGEERSEFRLVGFLGPDAFYAHAQKAIGKGSL